MKKPGTRGTNRANDALPVKRMFDGRAFSALNIVNQKLQLIKMY